MSVVDENSLNRRIRGLILALLVFLPVWLWIFWPVLAGGKSVGFRDAVYMHYPVLKWTTGEMMAGRLPVWSPHDGAGMPVIGDGSTAVFYPLKAILFLPGCSFVFRYNLFLALHVLLACVSGAWCARRLGCSRVASLFAGLSFGFSGPVLFQVTNQIYLVSAAWLPVAFGSIRDLFRQVLSSQRWVRSVATCSVAMSLMVLGGDPQMAAMVVVLFAGTIAASWLVCWSPLGRGERPGLAVSLVPVRRQVFSLATVCALSLLLAAAQILPSADFARYSERSVWQQPRNIYELADAIFWPGDREVAVTAESLIGDPEPGTHHDHIYQFSQPPWSLVELVLPGVSGSPWPDNTRWLDGLPGADRMWNVSLYQGGLVFFLALSAVFLLRSRLDRWLIGVGLFFCLASFGWYGLGWAVRELCPALGYPDAFQWLGRPTGGIWWFLVTFVPLVSGFRYPAKLFVLATLCMALLAARNLDRLNLVTNRKFVSRLVLAASMSFLVVLLSGLPDWMTRQVHGLPAGSANVDSFFGPTELAGSMRHVYLSLIHAICAGLIAVTGIFVFRNRVRYLPVLFLLLLMMELAVCQSRLVPVIDSAILDVDSVSEPLSGKEPQRVSGYRTVWLGHCVAPADWSEAGSPGRLEEIARWQMDHHVPRFNWISQIVRLDFFGSLQPDPNRLPWLPVLDSPQRSSKEILRFRVWHRNAGLVELAANDSARPSWGLTPRIFAIPQDDGADTLQYVGGPGLLLAHQRGELLLPVLELNGDEESRRDNSMMKITQDSPGRIEVEYRFAGPMKMVLPEGWCGGWQATANEGGTGPIRLTATQDRAGAVVNLPAGTGQITFSCFPGSVLSGMSVSLIAWTILAGIQLAPVFGRFVIRRDK